MKKYLLFLFAMLYGHVGAWATDATKAVDNSALVITTNDDSDLSSFTIDLGNNEGWMLQTKSEIRIIGNITQIGLNKLGNVIEELSSSWATPADNTLLNLSGATLSGVVTTMPAMSKVNRVTFPSGTDLKDISFPSNYTYGYSAPSAGVVNVYVASGTNSVPELTTAILDDASTVYVSGDGAAVYIATLTTEQQAKCSIPYNGRAEAIGGSIDGSHLTGLPSGTAVTEVTDLTVTGTLTSSDVTYIKGSLTGLKTLNLSGTTLSVSQLIDILESSSASVTVNANNISGWADVSSKYITAAMLAKMTGLTANDFISNLTNTTVNYVEDEASLVVTGILTSGDLSTVKNKLDANGTLTTLDVSHCANNSGEVAINDSYLSTSVATVSLPGNDYITYSGSQATKLENGALTIDIGSGSGKYADVATALNNSALSDLLNSGNVKHVKVTGELSETDLGNLHSIGSTYTGKVETIDVSAVTLASGVAWTSLSGDFGNAGLLLPNGTTTETLTNANIFSVGDEILNATKNVAETFNDELEYFALSTGKSIVKTNATNSSELLALDGVNTVISNDGKGAVILPNHQVTAAEKETLVEKVPTLTYIYSPTSDSQTRAEQFVPDFVWVCQPGGLDDAVNTESKLQSAIYVKIVSDVVLNSADLNLKKSDGYGNEVSEVKVSYDGNHGWQFCDFSEATLDPSTVGDVKSAHNLPYRIILPNNVTNDQMAGFAANPNHGSLAAVYSYSGTPATTLNILEIEDPAYSQTALADQRIVRSGTTTLNIIKGSYDGVWGNFGSNLLAAINNAVSTITTVNITTNIAPSTLTFDNDNITSLTINGVTSGNPNLNVTACDYLSTLDLTGSTFSGVNGPGCSNLTSVNMTGTTVTGATDLSNSGLSTLTTSRVTSLGGNVDLSSTALTSFVTESRITGNIDLTAASSLASVDVSNATFQNDYSTITVESGSNSGVYISALKHDENSDGTPDKSIKIPTGFSTDRIIPHGDGAVVDEVNISSLIEEKAVVAARVVKSSSNMTLHLKDRADDHEADSSDDASVDNYLYWYADNTKTNDIRTVTTTNDSGRSLTDIVNSTATDDDINTSDLYTIVKIVGPLTVDHDNNIDDVTLLSSIKTIVLDLSEATVDNATLKSRFASNALNSETKFLILPNGSTRENLLNATDLAGLKNNLYCALSIEETAEGKNLTSYNFVSGSLQPAVIATDAGRFSTSWVRNNHNVYTTGISDFKAVKISGLINAYDLSGPAQNLELDADGHLTWTESLIESYNKQTRTYNGGNTVYGPFKASFNLTEIDLRDAYFEEKGNNTGLGEQYKRYYVEDMTLSYLGLITTATYKVVIPQDKRVHEIPADFMNCSTNIRAICIPSNIQAIRTRAFWTIDYVWTTNDAFATSTATSDPEGQFTRLDNGAKLNDGTQVNALIFNNETNKYEENPAFLNSYYTANYSGVNGGGTYTFGSTIKLIETGAFANTQPNVKDVYVLNTVAPECHVDAFNTVMYTGNGGYNPTAVSAQGIITRAAYYNGRWITMLHYPRQTTDPQIQRYTDPTRNYSIATGERDGKGSPLYFPNQSEFIRAYQQGTYGYTWNAWDPTRTYGSVDNGTLTNTTEGWTAANQSTANGLYNSNEVTNGDLKKYYVFYDTGANNNEVTTKANNPSAPVNYYQIDWDASSYTYSSASGQGNLYLQSEKETDIDADGSSEKTSKDYRGWHQFVLNAYAANTVLKEEPYRSYITDTDWWTFCPTFDITKAEAIELFGGATSSDIPYVSRLLYVRREYDNDRIFLNFSNNLMVYKEDRSNATEGYTEAATAQHGSKTNGMVNILSTGPSDNDVVMAAGVPYLIKPNFVGGSIRQFLVFESTDEMNKVTNQDSHYRYVADETLYNKIKAAQTMSGSAQIALIQSGLYNVPVFVNGESVVEDHDNVTYTLEGSSYNKSNDWKYTFVGSFYLSPLPQYSYFLGKASSTSPAQFFYNNYTPYSSNNFRWANETGVICPTKTSNSLAFTVTPATDMQHPAHWSITTQLDDDSFTPAASRGYYNMVFGSGVVDIDESTGITDRKLSEKNASKVFSVNGQQRGNSLKGLTKGVYIMNGQKYVVK